MPIQPPIQNIPHNVELQPAHVCVHSVISSNGQFGSSALQPTSHVGRLSFLRSPHKEWLMSSTHIEFT